MEAAENHKQKLDPSLIYHLPNVDVVALEPKTLPAVDWAGLPNEKLETFDVGAEV